MNLLLAVAVIEFAIILVLLAALILGARKAAAVHSELLDRLMSRTWHEYRVVTDKPIPVRRSRHVPTDAELAERERKQHEGAAAHG